MSEFRESFRYHFTDDEPWKIREELEDLRYEKLILECMACSTSAPKYTEIVKKIEEKELELRAVMIKIMSENYS
uniref:Uncharacterized protein n=1 Tax=Ochrobactrum phage ORM_20 TaxID=2985243 RepID=A0A9N6WS55_9VIRU|nr:hypothetical protein ORM20_00152 [Ochrobactrum phage ORM_20]